MLRTSHRLAVLSNHLCVHTKRCAASPSFNKGCPTISVSPDVGIVDESVTIQLSGLESKQPVTLVATVKENGIKFESRCVYQTDEDGRVDNFTGSSTAGTFLGIEPMGLFWSLKTDPPTRLIKKDVGSPMILNLQVFKGSHTEAIETMKPIAETKIQRYFKKPGVKRIPLEGKFRGTMFVPEGKGPFPALIDMYGGLVSLIETRASLLASHGYVTMALSYMSIPGLPDDMLAADFDYIRGAYEWLMDQEFVDKNRLGAFGLCYGGTLCLQLTAALPEIRAVVNVNGLGAGPGPEEEFSDEEKTPDNIWPSKHRVFHTEEGFDITRAFDCANPIFIPAWQHGAKILVICGLDDKQVHPKWHQLFYENCPDEYKSNIQIYRYHGAGHMIEPPHIPHVRSILPGRKRLSSLFFVPEEYYDMPMMTGGWAATHAHAQEDSWKKILHFLDHNLKS